MTTILRNALALLGGLMVGSITNMGMINVGHSLVPPPGGVPPQSMEEMIAMIPQMEAPHFLFPFLAHAVGTLIGAYVVARFAASNHLRLALVIGVFFLLGGIYMVSILPGHPIWFTILDLGVAYIPMAWLGYYLGTSRTRQQ